MHASPSTKARHSDAGACRAAGVPHQPGQDPTPRTVGPGCPSAATLQKPARGAAMRRCPAPSPGPGHRGALRPSTPLGAGGRQRSNHRSRPATPKDARPAALACRTREPRRTRPNGIPDPLGLDRHRALGHPGQQPEILSAKVGVWQGSNRKLPCPIVYSVPAAHTSASPRTIGEGRSRASLATKRRHSLTYS
jgi:hypothetical protein